MLLPSGEVLRPSAATFAASDRARARNLELGGAGIVLVRYRQDARLSERTVEWHVKQAMKRLEAKNRIQAVVLAIRDGLIAP